MKATRRPATRVDVVTYDGTTRATRHDEVVTEEPLQIRAQGPGQPLRDVAVTMRTPGNDFELAVGFLAGEGLLTSGEDLREVRYCDVDPGEPQLYNVLTVALSTPLPERAFASRSVVGASCGTCGKTSIEDVRVLTSPVPATRPIPISTLVELPAQLRGTQSVFDRTGGLHAAGHARADGTIVTVREDVGRHNAVDKVVGASLLTGPPVEPGDVLVLSGRVSFEMVQKAVLARFGVIVAVSAPTSLAVSAADELGVTILGFTRNQQANVYSHMERVTFDA